jgi:hypothetical protein
LPEIKLNHSVFKKSEQGSCDIADQSSCDIQNEGSGNVPNKIKYDIPLLGLVDARKKSKHYVDMHERSIALWLEIKKRENGYQSKQSSVIDVSKQSSFDIPRQSSLDVPSNPSNQSLCDIPKQSLCAIPKQRSCDMGGGSMGALETLLQNPLTKQNSTESGAASIGKDTAIRIIFRKSSSSDIPNQSSFDIPKDTLDIPKTQRSANLRKQSSTESGGMGVPNHYTTMHDRSIKKWLEIKEQENLIKQSSTESAEPRWCGLDGSLGDKTGIRVLKLNRLTVF